MREDLCALAPDIKSQVIAKLRVSLVATWNELLETRRVRKIRGYSALFELRVPAWNGDYRIFLGVGQAELGEPTRRWPARASVAPEVRGMRTPVLGLYQPSLTV